MKRPWLILTFGFGLAILAYCGVYYCGIAERHSALPQTAPELGWLKQEYGLDDRQFARIAQLHEAYQSKCAEMCSRIDAKNARLVELLAATNTVTPEIKKALAETAEVRAECQAAMLEHFYEVSRAMPPEQGRRYLDWVHRQTLNPTHPMVAQPASVSSAHDRSGH